MKHLLLLLIATTMCSYIGNDCYAQTASEWYSKGDKAYKDKDYNKAIECFTKAIEQNYSHLSYAYVYRGVVKYNLKQYTAAIKDYDKAILLDSNYDNAYYNRGNAKCHLKQYTAAIKDHDKAILLNRNFTYAYYSRGNAKCHLKQYTAAIKDYDKGILLDKNSTYIHIYYNKRGYCYLKIGQYKKAIADWKRMEIVAPSSYITDNDYIAEAKMKLSEQSQQTLSKAIVSWEHPTIAYLKTSKSIHTLKACIESNSPITDVVLYIDQKPYSSRDFTIEEVNTTCDYEYKQRIEITSRNKPIYLTLEVTNGAGKVIAERVIEVEEKKIEAEKEVKKENIEVKAEKRLALVVGNSKYKEGGSLKNPRNDAEDMTKTLETLGFTVQRYYNLNDEKLKKAISKFGSDLKNYDVGLFFYAGHGIQYKGKNYLVPTDAVLEYETNVEFECVDVGRVLSNMEGAKSDVNIVMLDACRNNPFERRWRRTSKGNGLAPTTAPQGTIIIYSADAGQVADDNPSGRNGLFTGELLKHITTKGLSIENVLKRTGQSVFEKSGKQQMPASYSKFWGDFYFKR